MKDNGLDLIDMDLVNKFGLMVLNIREIGKKIKLRVKENLHIQIAMSIKVNGKMIKLMDMEYLYMPKAMQDTKDIGKMI
jgi:hypothetical protein